ncbi:MAG: YbjQ family protein [Acidobacteria bacterium]|jgi:uncharacterized protein YbjQ (UPF0145 family)|nr:YbjQ family protein [Acidobacteriota bacterium]
MIVSATPTVVGKRVARNLGVVYGNTIRARHIGRDILAQLKGVIGGEIEEYTKLMAEAREQAIDRMVAQAKARGATAVVNVRFSTSYIMTNASEILSFGEAVVLEPE